MAVPARHTSSAKKNRRRTHYKLTAPTVTFDELLVTTVTHIAFHLKATTKAAKFATLNNSTKVIERDYHARKYYT